jgi:Winged helix DNA-binding domain
MSRTDGSLDRRSLNRALLARQLLLERVNRSPAEVTEHLVGLQAQEPIDPYIALWSRIEGFDPMSLSDLLADRRAVRAQLLRATIHLVTDRDMLTMRPVLRPVLERMLWSGSPFGRSLARAGVDVDAVVEAGRRLLAEQPRTRAELRDALGPQFPAADSAALAQAVTFLVPVVQVPPRALWQRSGQARWATVESWLGRPLSGDASPDGLVLRYLAAFGPANAADVRAWSGLPAAAEVIERLRPRLRAFRDEQGRELVDLPDAPRPAPDTSAPIRFLPVYDNVILSHADRGRIVEEHHRRTVLKLDMISFGSILVDGFGRAIWRVEREPTGEAVTLDVALLEKLAAAETDAIGGEGERLLAFLEPIRTSREVRFRRLSTA